MLSLKRVERKPQPLRSDDRSVDLLPPPSMWLVENTKIVPRDAFEDMCACAVKAFDRFQSNTLVEKILMSEKLSQKLRGV
jgi:hypothetical protein